MLTPDQKFKASEIIQSLLSPEGKLKALEAFVKQAEKDNIVEQKAQEEQAKLEQAKLTPGIKNVKVEGAELVTVKGEKGDKGDKGEPGETITGPRGFTGPPGADSTVPGPKGEPGQSIVGPPGADGQSVDKAEIVQHVLSKIPKVKPLVLDGGEIIDKINALDTDEENQIDASHIKNLPKSTKNYGSYTGGGSKYVAGRNIAIDLNVVSLNIPIQPTPPENPVVGQFWCDNS